MEQGVERQNIQALLGHRDPKSTEVYYGKQVLMESNYLNSLKKASFPLIYLS